MSVATHYEAYFDFDNTITSFDVIDDVIERFSIDESWKQAEEAWKTGEIGSQECLQRQFSCVRVGAPVLRDYLYSIKIDPCFLPIVELLRSRGVAPVVVSDGFSSFISTILENNGVRDLQIYANDLRVEGDKPVLSFPYFHSICTKCGNCKTSHLFKRDRPTGTKKIYVGDGQSDICPAGFCEVLFAKGSLLRHYSSIRGECIPFQNLEIVYSTLQKLLK